MTGTDTSSYPYAYYLPEGHSEEKKLPLLIFLHGAGEKGTKLEKVKVHGPLKEVEKGKKLPFIIVAPQCPVHSYWTPDKIAELTDHAIEKFGSDPARTYISGISMGGFGTWHSCCHYPEKYAAAVPVCGGGNPNAVSKMKNIPTWAFHGAKDFVVPITESEVMTEALKAAGGNVRFTVYPEAGHDSWTETFENDEVYEWLLEKSKKHS